MYLWNWRGMWNIDVTCTFRPVSCTLWLMESGLQYFLAALWTGLQCGLWTVVSTWLKCILYCAVLCCAVLCCAVLCCAVLCCAVLACAVLWPVVETVDCSVDCSGDCSVDCNVDCGLNTVWTGLQCRKWTAIWMVDYSVDCGLQCRRWTTV